MEGVPLATEDDSEKKESRKSRRKGSRLGVFALETKTSRDDDPKNEKRESPWLKPPDPEAKDSKPSGDILHTEYIKNISETEAPLEEISETETPVIEQRLIKLARATETEHAPDLAADPEVVIADKAVENFRDLVEAGEGSEAAYSDVMANLGVEDDDKLGDEDTIGEDPALEAPDNFGDEIRIEHLSETMSEDEDNANNSPTTSNGAAGPGGAPPVPPYNPGSVGYNSPSNDPGPTVPGGPPFGPNSGGGGPGNFDANTQPTSPADPNTMPDSERYHHPNPAAMALFGGIIGYLIGRRRGRIKTEKKLLPIQKKLEKQVDGLRWQIQDREAKIRRAAAERVKTRGPVAIEEFSKAAAESKPSPEADPQQHAQSSPDHIGHVLITGTESSPTATRIDKSLPEAASPSKAIPEKPVGKLSNSAEDKHVATLSRAELLALSEKIIVGDSSLHQIYETHLVGERGLRRLVAEYMEGGDLKKALRQEVTEREIDFERDPVVRDIKPGQASAAKGSKALNEILEKASLSVNAGDEEAAFFKARARYESNELQQHKQQRRLVDIALAVTITVLVLAVFIMYLSRG